VKSLEGQGTTITVELPTETRQIAPSIQPNEAATLPETSRIEGLLTINSKE
jgi:hypothetical protein